MQRKNTPHSVTRYL